jgi:outer membrane lipoprotein-sorting protein
MSDALSPSVDWVWIVVPILVVLGFHLIGSIALFFAKLPHRASPPEAVDLMALPGVNRAFLETGSVKLKELGFRHLLDFELPHTRTNQTRLLLSSHCNSNGTIQGTLCQRFATQFAHDFYSFTTYFTTGHRLVTTTNPMPDVDLSPFLHFQRFPDSKDMEGLLRRHEAALAVRPASWGEPEFVSRTEDIERLSSAGWAREVDYLCAKGIFRVEGDSIRATVFGAGTFFWKGIRPFPANVAPMIQLRRIGIPSLLALALAFAISKLSPGSETLLLWAMGGVGSAFGFGLWYHAYFWCLAVPSCAVFLATQRPDLAARSAVYATCGLAVGFLISAARSQSRGRKLMAHQPMPQPASTRKLFRLVIALAIFGGILSGFYNSRGLKFGVRRDPAAEAAFQRIEQTITGAKTLRVRFERRITGRNGGPQFVGTLLVKEGNRVSLSVKPQGADPGVAPEETLFISNGNTLALFLRTEDGVRQAMVPTPITSENLNAKVTMVLSHKWIPIALQALLTPLDELKEQCDVTSLRMDPKSGNENILSYDVGTYSATLRIDPRTGLPQARVLTDRYVIGGQKAYFNETFQEWVLNEEIPDEAFEFPKTK